LASGEVHVYGRDETVDAVRAAKRAGVFLRAHGAGMGVAVMSDSADLEDAARAVADDVVVFDQRGCLSPRVAVVIGDPSRGERFAAALAARLAETESHVPRGRVDEGEMREAARYAETMAFAGMVWRGEGHVVGLVAEGGLVVPPPGRHVHVVRVPDVAAARHLLKPIERQIVAVGCDVPDLGGALVCDVARVRISALGHMQRPPFDGPVDLR
jgi:hypothetical protein